MVSAMEKMVDLIKNMEQSLEVSWLFENGSMASHIVIVEVIFFEIKAGFSKNSVLDLEYRKGSTHQIQCNIVSLR